MTTTRTTAAACPKCSHPLSDHRDPGHRCIRAVGLAQCGCATTRTTAYTVTNATNGPCLYATCDLDDAISYAQINADRDLVEHPHLATPHYVITGWNVVSIRTAAHIYGTTN